jgi:hypothetical protein
VLTTAPAAYSRSCVARAWAHNCAIHYWNRAPCAGHKEERSATRSSRSRRCKTASSDVRDRAPEGRDLEKTLHDAYSGARVALEIRISLILLSIVHRKLDKSR